MPTEDIPTSTSDVDPALVIELHVQRLADSLGFTVDCVRWVYCSIIVLAHRKRAVAEKPIAGHVTAREVCVVLMRDLESLHDGPLEPVLNDLKLRSSEAVGLIVYGLVECKLIGTSEGDSPADFADIFHVDQLDAFLDAEGIVCKRMSLRLAHRYLIWGLYGMGCTMIAGSFFDVVGTEVGRVGWFVGMAGYVLQFFRPPEKKRYL